MSKPIGTQEYQKVFAVRSMLPEPGDTLAMIQRYAPEPLTAEQVYMRREWLANDQVDRSFERFTTDTLAQFAATIPGKSKLMGHDYKAAPIGRYFDATIEQDENGTHWLAPSWYTVKTAENEHARAQIDGGVWSYVSIGFTAEQLVCDVCGESFYSWDCPHFPGQEYPTMIETPQLNGGVLRVEGPPVVCTLHYEGAAEAVEGSIVYLGCQYDARIVKTAGDIEIAHAGKLAGLKQTRKTMSMNGFQATDLFPTSTVVTTTTTPEPKASDLPESWEDFAVFVCTFYGGRGGMECDREATWKAIAARYAMEGKELPAVGDKHVTAAETAFSGIVWLNGEKHIFENTKFAGDVESVRNITRHFVKEGRVLSAANLALVQDCIDSLTALRDAAIVMPPMETEAAGVPSAAGLKARDVIAGVAEALRKEREAERLESLKRIAEQWKT